MNLHWQDWPNRLTRSLWTSMVGFIQQPNPIQTIQHGSLVPCVHLGIYISLVQQRIRKKRDKSKKKGGQEEQRQRGNYSIHDYYWRHLSFLHLFVNISLLLELSFHYCYHIWVFLNYSSAALHSFLESICCMMANDLLMILFLKITMPIECFQNILGKLKEEATAANTKYQNIMGWTKKMTLPSLDLQRTNKTEVPQKEIHMHRGWLEAEKSRFKSTPIGL